MRVLDSLRADVHEGGWSPADGVDFVDGDVREPEAIRAALRGVTVVSHQAAKVGLGVDFADATDYVASNDLGTVVLIAGMAAAGIDRDALARLAEGHRREDEPSAPAQATAR